MHRRCLVDQRAICIWRCSQGLGITTGTVLNNVRQTPLIQTMFSKGIIAKPAFTIAFTEFNPVQGSFNPLKGQPGAPQGFAKPCASCDACLAKHSR